MKKRGKFFTTGLIIALFLMINFFGGAIKFSTDYLWFKEIGYTQTFLTKIKSQLVIGIPLFFILSVLLYIFISKLKKKYDLETGIVDVKTNKSVRLWIKLFSALISFLITSNVVSTMWFEIL